MSFYKEVPGRKTTLESALKFDNEPKAGSTNPVTSDGVKGAIGNSAENLLDDHDPVDTEISDTSKKFYNEHELGYYYAIGDKVYLCTERTRSGEPGSYTYSTKLTKQNGVVPVLNHKLNTSDKSIIDAGSATYASDTLTIPQGKFVDATSTSLGASVTLVFANAESVTLPWWWFRIATTAGVTLSVPSGYGFMGEALTTLEANKTYEFVVIANKISWAVSA